MTITGFKSTDIESRSKVEPATVTKHGYKRQGIDVNTFVGYLSLGTSVTSEDSTLSQITLVSLPSGLHVGCLAGTTQASGNFIEIIEISGNTITLGRNLPSVYAAFQNVTFYKPTLLTADSTGALRVVASITGIPSVNVLSTPYSAETGTFSPPAQAVQLGYYDPISGIWFGLPVTDPYGINAYSASVNVGGGGISLLDATGTAIAATNSAPSGVEIGLVTRNIPSGEQDISYAAPTVTTGNITASAQSITVALNGNNSVAFSIRGTYGSVAIAFEASLDGTNWYTVQARRLDSNTIETASGTISNTSRAWEASVNGMHSFRVRSTAWTSGTANIQINASYSATEPIPAIASHAVTLTSTTITSVVPGTAATNLGKAIDSVPGATDTGIANLAQRVDSPGVLTPANGDYFLLRGNNLGQLWVAAVQSGTWGVNTLDGTGNKLIQSTSSPAATDGGLNVRNMPAGPATGGLPVSVVLNTATLTLIMAANSLRKYLYVYNTTAYEVGLRLSSNTTNPTICSIRIPGYGTWQSDLMEWQGTVYAISYVSASTVYVSEQT